MKLWHLRYFVAVCEVLRRTDESVEKVRALARGEYGELHVGYAPSPTVEILPPALAAYQRAFSASGSCCTTSPSRSSSTGFRTAHWNSRSCLELQGSSLEVWNLRRCGA